METMTLDELKAAIKSQGVPIEDVTFECPHCHTLQSMNDLIAVGAGKNREAVEPYIGFSCIGRFTKEKGCDWTLGGLFQIHELEVITPDGEHHPIFKPISANPRINADLAKASQPGYA